MTSQGVNAPRPLAPARRLLLVRHSIPAQEPGRPAREWRLSERGGALVRPLARRAMGYGPSTLACSDEPRAVETARLLAAGIGPSLPLATDPDLREHDRTGVGYLGERAFADALSRFFAHPRELVFGRESAAHALDRFSRAVSRLTALSSPGAILVVTHGTVLSLFVAAAADFDAHTFWRALPLPALVVLAASAPPRGGPHEWRLEEVWSPEQGRLAGTK